MLSDLFSGRLSFNTIWLALISFHIISSITFPRRCNRPLSSSDPNLSLYTNAPLPHSQHKYIYMVSGKMIAGCLHDLSSPDYITSWFLFCLLRKPVFHLLSPELPSGFSSTTPATMQLNTRKLWWTATWKYGEGEGYGPVLEYLFYHDWSLGFTLQHCKNN